MAFFPDENSHFNLDSVGIPRYATLLVEGSLLQASPQTGHVLLL